MGLQCIICETVKDETEFYTKKKICVCNVCNNTRQYQKYKKYYTEKRKKRNSDPRCIPHIRAYNKKWIKNKRHNDINYRIKGNLRNRIRDAIKGRRKSATTIKLLGCSWDDYVKYIESLFTYGMTWNNYGRGNGKWNIDHIIPLASFDFNVQGEQEKAFHFTNTQPLWEIDNFKKGSKYVDI